MQLTRPRAELVYERVYSYILREIQNGNLRPGTQLASERSLSEALGVSRASVRHAISMLASRGYVAVTPRGGAVVLDADANGILDQMAILLSREVDDILNLLEVRKILESSAARLAATRATPAEILTMRKAALAVEKAWRSGSVDNQAAKEFNLSVVKAAHNPLLVRMWRVVANAMGERYHTVRAYGLAGEHGDAFLNEHLALCDAIASGDGEKAAAIVSEHIERTAQVLMATKPEFPQHQRTYHPREPRWPARPED